MKSLHQTTLVGLRYWEHTQGEVRADTPIVLALHWMTGDAKSLLFLLESYPQPLRYIALQGSYPSGDASLGGYSWYPDEINFYQRSESEQLPAILSEVERIAVFVQQLNTLYPAKIAVTGISQGGDLSLALAVYHPELFDMVLACAGRLFPPTSPDLYPQAQAKLPQVHILHGVDDEIVPRSQAEQAADWLRAAGFGTKLHLYLQTGHGMNKSMIRDIQRALMTR